MRPSKEQQLEKDILSMIPSSLHTTVQKVLTNEYIHSLQRAANLVSIKRLGYTDHGPVHMRQVSYNALIIADLLHQAGISFTLEKEESGDYEDSLLILVLSGMLHDIGMAITRDRHEDFSCSLGSDVLKELLSFYYDPSASFRSLCVYALVQECIVGHMGVTKTHSLESGILLIADGCDMTKGRARIPMMANTSGFGDIHMYSSLAVEKLVIKKGQDKPVHIQVTISEAAGVFQIEEVFFPKINVSTAKEFIELTAVMKNKKIRRYL